MKASTLNDSPTQNPTLEDLAIEWALECLCELRRGYGEDPAAWSLDESTWGEGWTEIADETRDCAHLDLMNQIRSRLGLNPL